MTPRDAFNVPMELIWRELSATLWMQRLSRGHSLSYSNILCISPCFITRLAVFRLVNLWPCRGWIKRTNMRRCPLVWWLCFGCIHLGLQASDGRDLWFFFVQVFEQCLRGTTLFIWNLLGRPGLIIIYHMHTSNELAETGSIYQKEVECNVRAFPVRSSHL